MPRLPYLRRRITPCRSFHKRSAYVLLIFLLIVSLFVFCFKAASYLRRLTGEMAMSDAIDMVTLAVNETVNRIMAEGDYGYDYFVTIEKDNEGNVAAISANMSRINAVSARVLSEVVEAAENGVLDIKVPLGNLLGSNILMGKGPDVLIEVITLTSSYIDIENELVSTGINQAKHKIILKIDVDVDILIPWDVLTTRVESNVLIAETVIVGEVPETYVAVE
ncbi:MAG: sporulation protein YunB [Oscillospiraceae bacterium]|nr:sporulation protein YunB [Oscillospiraceae bacterium]